MRPTRAGLRRFSLLAIGANSQFQ